MASAGNKKNAEMLNLQQSINLRDSMISGGTKVNYQLSSDDNDSQNEFPAPFDPKPAGQVAQKRQEFGLHLVN